MVEVCNSNQRACYFMIENGLPEPLVRSKYLAEVKRRKLTTNTK